MNDTSKFRVHMGVKMGDQKSGWTKCLSVGEHIWQTHDKVTTKFPLRVTCNHFVKKDGMKFWFYT